MRCPDCGAENLAGEESCASCDAPLSLLATPQPKPGMAMQSKILEGTIRELKPREAICLKETDSVAEAVAVMRRSKTGCVLATRHGRLTGIFTERDLLMRVAGVKDPAQVPLSAVMAPEPHTLSDDDSIAFAFHTMAIHAYRHIPITRSDGSGLGVISARDLLRYLCE